MAYPVAMETLAALSRDIWERTPPEAQAYIGTLEARVATLEDMVRTLLMSQKFQKADARIL